MCGSFLISIQCQLSEWGIFIISCNSINCIYIIILNYRELNVSSVFANVLKGVTKARVITKNAKKRRNICFSNLHVFLSVLDTHTLLIQPIIESKSQHKFCVFYIYNSKCGRYRFSITNVIHTYHITFNIKCT